MMTFKLTNQQREYFGLDPIKSHWDRVMFKGGAHQSETLLYFEGDTIKRHIVTTENRYLEVHYDELTKGRTILLPKTDKGKEKKLTLSVLEQRQPNGVYLNASDGHLTIGNYSTQTTFYSTRWETNEKSKKTISEQIIEFIEHSSEKHLDDIRQFKNAKRKNIKYKSGDYFCFKLDRINFGFGRLLFDVNKFRKKRLIKNGHGLDLILGMPLVIQLFAYKSAIKNIDVSILDKQPKLPSDIMMDNLLLYGEYEIIGHRELKEEEFDFPISYGRSIDQKQVIFIQWGLMHKELPQEKFDKYIVGEKEFDQNPYGYYSIGFRPHYDTIDINKALKNNGVFDFANSIHYQAKWDLRNPSNKNIKIEIFKEFGLDPEKNYIDNCELTGTHKTMDLLKKI